MSVINSIISLHFKCILYNLKMLPDRKHFHGYNGIYQLQSDRYLRTFTNADQHVGILNVQKCKDWFDRIYFAIMERVPWRRERKVPLTKYEVSEDDRETTFYLYNADEHL